jgi:hypothetical protein
VVSLGSPVSSPNKTDHHDITEILLKVALNTIKQTNKQYTSYCLTGQTHDIKLVTYNFKNRIDGVMVSV